MALPLAPCFDAGKRIGEILGPQWPQVDLAVGRLVLEAAQAEVEPPGVVYLSARALKASRLGVASSSGHVCQFPKTASPVRFATQLRQCLPSRAHTTTTQTQLRCSQGRRGIVRVRRGEARRRGGPGLCSTGRASSARAKLRLPLTLQSTRSQIPPQPPTRSQPPASGVGPVTPSGKHFPSSQRDQVGFQRARQGTILQPLGSKPNALSN